MEAVWTRFFPLTGGITKPIENGALGPIHRVIVNISFGENIEEAWGTTNRMVNLDLAGGALLDRRSCNLSSTRCQFPIAAKLKFNELRY